MPEGIGKLPVCSRIILGPKGEPFPPVPVEPAAIAVIGAWGEHQAGESPLRLLLPIRRQRHIAVFDGRVFAEGELESIRGANQSKRAPELPRSLRDPHARALVR